MKAASVWLLALALAVPAAHAVTTVRVDDSGTVVNQPVVAMQWRKLVRGRAADNNADAQVRVALRLNLAQWLNQSVRLYMALAPVNGDPVQASWRTQGRLLAGTVRSGGRTLIYNGPVTAAVLEETIDLTLTTDGRNLTSPQALQFYFELDLP
jgi:hypothetical protein